MPITIPAAWLNPLPPGYRIPVWRWIILPATAYMLWKAKGTWIGGNLTLESGSLNFIQKGLLKAKHPAQWRMPLRDIENLEIKKGMASEIIEITFNGITTKVMSVRTDEFMAALRTAVANAARTEGGE